LAGTRTVTFPDAAVTSQVPVGSPSTATLPLAARSLAKVAALLHYDEHA
jgi:hypothetical protein